jgi:glycosyltransferase involved in cell wall biosynthesis
VTATDVNAFPISGCVIAFQEEDRIADCVASLAFCDEVLVVDSGSEDRTRELAEAAGARVLVNTPFPGHKEQKQLAVDAATHDRVLCLDADERVTDALREEIEVLRSSGWPASAYEVERRNHYLGRVVNHGMFGPERKIRLFDRRQAKWGGTNPHDRVEVDPGAATTKLRGAIEHLSYRDFAHHKSTIESFTKIAAQAMHDRGRRAAVWDPLMRPPAAAIKSILFQLGFLDGWRGFAIAWMAGYYDWVKYRRLRALGSNRG